MAVQLVNRLPFINQYAYITSKFWEPRGTHYHKGVDLAVSGNNVQVYSMVNGRVIYRGYDGSGYGNYLIIKEDTTNLGFLYAHFSTVYVALNERVTYKQAIGVEGRTGDATGNHVHLEMQDLTNRNWRYSNDRSDYINPADWIPYTEIIGDQLYWDTTEPPVPYPNKYRKFKWVLYANKLRTKY